MGKRRRKTGAALNSDFPATPAPGHGRNREERGTGSWFASKRPVLRFVLIFAVLLGLFELVWALPVFRDRYFPRYLELNAWAGAAGIRLFGHEARANKATISSPQCTILIARGCDAIQPTAIFLSALIAFPAAWSARIAGALIGAALLLVLNLARIVSLFFIRLHKPEWFHTMHVDVWQSVFIFLALLLWLVWAFWATRPRAIATDATQQTA